MEHFLPEQIDVSLTFKSRSKYKYVTNILSQETGCVVLQNTKNPRVPWHYALQFDIKTINVIWCEFCFKSKTENFCPFWPMRVSKWILLHIFLFAVVSISITKQYADFVREWMSLFYPLGAWITKMHAYTSNEHGSDYKTIIICFCACFTFQ